ncbi:MAG: hypothetical protein ACYCVW_12810 [Rhodocyclaceae bacterium]
MFNKLAQFIDRHRLPIPDRFRLPAKYAPAVFLSSFLIAFGALMLLFATVFGVHLFSQPSPHAPKADQAEIEQMVFELRAHAYTEVVAMQTSVFRQSLESLRLAAAPDQRDAALRLAKEVRMQALRHLAEVEAIALPADKQPDIAALRAELADLDRQLAAMPGTQGN